MLHDGLQQLLVAAKLRVTLLPRADPSGVAAGCREVESCSSEAMAASRTLTGELSPPILQTGGLVAGLEWLVRWKAEKYHLAVELDADPAAVPDSEAMTLLLFQSVRELLFNMVKHAQVHAARVEVRRQDGHLQIVVSDQGVGFDPATLPATSSWGAGPRQHPATPGVPGRLRGHRERPRPGVPDHPGGAACRARRVRRPSPSRAASDGRPLHPAAPRAGEDPRALGGRSRGGAPGPGPDARCRTGSGGGRRGGGRQGRGGAHEGAAAGRGPHGHQHARLNGIDATRQIHADCPGVQVIGLSMFGATEQTAAMQQAGAVGYVSKSAPAEELLAAIRACAAGNPAMDPDHEIL